MGMGYSRKTACAVGEAANGGARVGSCALWPTPTTVCESATHQIPDRAPEREPPKIL